MDVGTSILCPCWWKLPVLLNYLFYNLCLHDKYWCKMVTIGGFPPPARLSDPSDSLKPLACPPALTDVPPHSDEGNLLHCRWKPTVGATGGLSCSGWNAAVGDGGLLRVNVNRFILWTCPAAAKRLTPNKCDIWNWGVKKHDTFFLNVALRS